MTGTKSACTRFLVSVRSPEEALIALSGGADIIDVKEPREGALGAVDVGRTAEIVRIVASRRRVSATIGDCELAQAPDRVLETAATGVDYVKIGLFGDLPDSALEKLERHAARGIRLIAVIFADKAPDWTWIARLAEAGFSGVMLDTADKMAGGLRSHLTPGALSHFLSETRVHRLIAGLAGSLQEADARALVPLRPDVLGFRGALCGGGRRSDALDASRVAAMRALIPQDAQTRADAGQAVMAGEG